MKYEVWSKDRLGKRDGLPERTHYTLDASMDSAKELSRGSVSKKVFNPKKKPTPLEPYGGYDDVQVPNAFAVIERGDKQSRVRGWGIGGVWLDSRVCKRCNNSGQDPNSYGEPCSSCKGSSYVPKV